MTLDENVLPEFKQVSHMLNMLDFNVSYMFDVINFSLFHPQFEEKLYNVKKAIDSLRQEYQNNFKFQY